MAGIVGIVGDGASLDRAQAAARPLARRRGQAVALLDRDALAVACVTPRGGTFEDRSTGVTAVFDGELLLEHGSVSGVEAAQAIIDLYLARGAALDPPEGTFAAALWDEPKRRLVLVTDLHGHHPLYFARRAGEILFATELKALVAAGLVPQLDLGAWAEMLAYETPLGEHTPLAGVRLLPPATTLTVSAAGQERAVERWRYRLSPEQGDDPRELVAEFGRLLERAVLRRREPTTGLALSGGLDSRCMASVLMRHAPGTLSATYGMPGSQDLLLGARVAPLAGLEHCELPLESGYLARCAAQTVWLAEGSVRCLHSHHLVLSRLRAESGLDSLLIGFAGDAVVRGHPAEPAPSECAFVDRAHRLRARCLSDELAEQVLAPSFLAGIRGLARDGLARALADEEGQAAERTKQFVFRQVHRRMIWPGTQLFADDLIARDPYVDRELLELCRRLPWSLRLGGRLQQEYLRTVPGLAGVCNPKDGVAPSLQGARRSAAYAVVKARRRTARLLDDCVGPRWRTQQDGLADYAAELRNGSRELLSVLLEPRTLERGQVRPQAVQRLVAETLSGRRRHTMVLGVLLNLELFQRQMLEGDVPCGYEEHEGRLLVAGA